MTRLLRPLVESNTVDRKPDWAKPLPLPSYIPSHVSFPDEARGGVDVAYLIPIAFTHLAEG